MGEASHDEAQNIEAMGWNSICAGEANQELWKKERERIRLNWSYFEDGCLCIRDGRIELKGPDVPDIYATLYYEHACTCSRNYKQAK